MSDIILSTINATFIHASLGLRYLYANLGDLQARAEIKEFTIKDWSLDIVEQLLASKPKIIGMGVYIWNSVETEAVVSQIKAVAPEVTIVLGGPEVSYEAEQQSLFQYVDYVLTGPSDLSFPQFCRDVLSGNLPDKKVLKSQPLDLADLQMPYEYFTDQDLSQRVLYVEASRGCPFKCEFCLSALDANAYPFELKRFLDQMETLYDRGARNFKFIDRTFNLKIDTTLAILDFFLARMDDDLYLHFELIPDHLPERLKEALRRFPEHSIQFEIGIQSFDPKVQSLISRRQKNQLSKDNIVWLKQNTTAHLHADLIFGLPGETLQSFETSFDELYACRPNEIQLGILKRLRGSPIIRHSDAFELRFNPLPPYNILSTDRVDFTSMQRVNRFARYWDMIGNSGRFKNLLPHLLLETEGESPFRDFLALSDWIFERTGQTHKINLKKLYEWVAQATEELFPERYDSVIEALEVDYQQSGLRSVFDTLVLRNQQSESIAKVGRVNRRQKRHA